MSKATIQSSTSSDTLTIEDRGHGMLLVTVANWRGIAGSSVEVLVNDLRHVLGKILKDQPTGPQIPTLPGAIVDDELTTPHHYTLGSDGRWREPNEGKVVHKSLIRYILKMGGKVVFAGREAN